MRRDIACHRYMPWRWFRVYTRRLRVIIIGLLLICSPLRFLPLSLLGNAAITYRYVRLRHAISASKCCLLTIYHYHHYRTGIDMPCQSIIIGHSFEQVHVRPQHVISCITMLWLLIISSSYFESFFLIFFTFWYKDFTLLLFLYFCFRRVLTTLSIRLPRHKYMADI